MEKRKGVREEKRSYSKLNLLKVLTIALGSLIVEPAIAGEVLANKNTDTHHIDTSKRSAVIKEIQKRLGKDYSASEMITLLKQDVKLAKKYVEDLSKNSKEADIFISRVSKGTIQTDFPFFYEAIKMVMQHIPHNKKVTRNFMYAIASGNVPLSDTVLQKIQEILNGASFTKDNRLARPVFQCLLSKQCKQMYRDKLKDKGNELLQQIPHNKTYAKYFLGTFVGSNPEDIPNYEILRTYADAASKYIKEDKQFAKSVMSWLKYGYVKQENFGNIAGILDWIGKDDEMTEDLLYMYMNKKIPEKYITKEIRDKIIKYLKEKIKKDKEYAESIIEALNIGIISINDVEILLPLIFEIYPDLKNKLKGPTSMDGVSIPMS